MTQITIKKMTIMLVMLLAVGGLNAPQAYAGKSSQQDKEWTWTENGKDYIRARLKDSKSAQFKGVFFSNSSGTPVTCGQVNSKNSFGAYSGYQYFVAASAELSILQNEVEDFPVVWRQLCAK